MPKTPRQRGKKFSDVESEKLVSLYEALKPRTSDEWEALLESYNESLADGESKRELKSLK